MNRGDDNVITPLHPVVTCYFIKTCFSHILNILTGRPIYRYFAQNRFLEGNDTSLLSADIEPTFTSRTISPNLLLFYFFF